MYKKLSEWQQDRQQRAVSSSRNTNGIDPTTWATSETVMEPDDPTLALHRARSEIAEVNEAIVLSRDRFNGRIAGRPLSADQYRYFMRRKKEIARRIIELELQCSQARKARRVIAQQENAIKDQAKAAIANSLPAVFMDMAKEMLAEDVYKRIFVAAVHRRQDRFVDPPTK